MKWIYNSIFSEKAKIPVENEKKVCLTKCINCSWCEGWVHNECTKLSENELKKLKYYFCSQKCNDDAIFPEDDLQGKNIYRDSPDNPQPPTSDKAQEIKKKEKIPKNKNSFSSVNSHLLDVECSYIDPNDLDTSILQKRNSEITIWQTNVRSINANFDKLDEVFNGCEKKLPDILALTETWLNDDTTAPDIVGYSFESVQSKGTKNFAGGVGIYVSNDLEYELQPNLDLKYKGCEDLWIKIRDCEKEKEKRSKDLILGVIYRHPNQSYKSFTDHLCKTLHALNEKKLNYVIVGDVNIDSSKYNVAYNITDYINTLNSFECNQFIDKPTRVKSNSSTCIDHVYSNLCTESIVNYIILSDISDHYSILSKVDYDINRKSYEPVYRRKTNLSEDEWYAFSFELDEKLKNTPLPDCPNDCAETIIKTYQGLIDKYMPLRKLSRKDKSFLDKPWITSEIRKYIKQKNKLYKKSEKSNDPQDITAYKNISNLLSKMKKKAYELYYREKIAKCGNDKAKTWRLINEITKRKKKKERSY